MSRIRSAIPALLALPMLCPAQLQFTEYSVQNAPSGYAMVPQRLTVGPDGNLWYTEYQPNYGASRLGRITLAGAMTEFPAKQGGGITVGSDGALWFVEWGYQLLGRMTTSGVFTEVPVNMPLTGYTTGDITRGADGNLWFLRDGLGFYSAMTVAKLTPSGAITTYSWNPPSGWSSLQRITAGPDGNLWVTEGTFGGVARVTPTGDITRYPLDSGIPTPSWITFGPGGDMWVTETHSVRRVPFPAVANPYLVSSLLRFDTNYDPACIRFSNIGGMTGGPDGNMWVAAGAELIRIAPNATQCSGISYFTVPYASASASSIITACDGNLWYTDAGTSAIGKVSIGGARVLSISSASPNGVYTTGANVLITVTFDDIVSVTGSPKVTLNSGGAAVYASGGGTNTLTFTYTIGSGESAARLDVAPDRSFLPVTCSDRAMALSLNGGTLRDSNGNGAILLAPVGSSAGSLASNKLLAINPPDTTPPVSAASASPGPNPNGWNKNDVTVQITATDLGGSGVKDIHYSLSGAQLGTQTVSGSSASVTINAEGTTTISFYATDNIGNVETAKTLIIRLDKTPPAITFGSASPPANAAGWNKTDVSVPFAAADAFSGVDTVTPASPLILSVEGPATTGVVTVTDLAGNSTTAVSPAFKIDKAPPTIAGMRAPLPNANNWNNTDVTVSFSCTDAGSGLAPGNPPADTVLSAEGANQAVNGICQDLAGNTGSVSVSGINIDKTKPMATTAAQPPPNAAGWNNGNVTVTIAATDNLSGIASCTAPATLSTEGAAQSASGVCTDLAGNTSDLASATGINIDKTPPAINGSRAPAANAAGWNNTDVTVTFTCADALSGLTSGSPPAAVIESAEGANQGAAGMCTDKAGNTASATVGGISIDKTPPLIMTSPAPGPNWYNSGVIVTFAGTDGLSGIAGCSSPVSLTADGAGQTASGTCADRAGNSASLPAAPFNIDRTKPVVSVLSANPSAVPLGSGLTLTAAISDSASGVGSAEYNVDGGSFAPLTAGEGVWAASVAPLGLGVHTVCARATDKAANQGDPLCLLVPVYDPTGGFVTGGGWITSPPGAYAPNPSLTGRATFGFSAKYQKGANTPSGDTQFRFQTGNLDFRSAAYEWLVVAGARAQFKGSGSLNGSGDYGFLLTAIDGDMPGGDGMDRFRIKIWAKDSKGGVAGIIYDNQMGMSDTGNDATELGGGNIVIHQ